MKRKTNSGLVTRFRKFCPDYSDKEKLSKYSTMCKSPHNTYFEIAVDTGILDYSIYNF